MSMDPNRWVNTIPFIGAKCNQKKYKLDSNRWVNTLPGKDDNTLILSNAINSNPKLNSGKKYSLTIIIFTIGLILVSVIKNETRNLQKAINNLQLSIDTVKFELHQATLDHEVITSPENISRLAKEYLETDLVFYKKSQIKQLNKKGKILTKLEETKNKQVFKKKNKDITEEIKLQIAKTIEKKKTELRKLKTLYSSPEKFSDEIKLQVAKKIKKTKTELKEIVASPKDSINLGKVQRWAGVQVVKAFLGIPIIPGK